MLRWAQAVTLGIAILGLNLVTGYSGQVSLGHSAFFGIGAYTTMILVADHGWPFLATLPVAGAIGRRSARSSVLPHAAHPRPLPDLGDGWDGAAFSSIVKKMESLTGGGNGKTITVGKGDLPNGFRWKAPSWVPGHPDDNAWIFVTVFLIAIVMFLLASNLVRSRVGQGHGRHADNEMSAILSGGGTAPRVKVMAFAVSAFWTAVGGGCFALAGQTIAPDSFGLQRSIELIAGLVIGGIATIIGPALGGVIVEFLPYLSFNVFPGPEAYVLLRADPHCAGLLHAWRDRGPSRLLKAKVVRVVPRLPDVHVRSPIAVASADDTAGSLRS